MRQQTFAEESFEKFRKEQFLDAIERIIPWQEQTAAIRTDRTTPGAHKPSVAVLPFVNMSDDKNQEYFAEGIAEDIIVALSKLHSLFVIARDTLFAYRENIGEGRQSRHTSQRIPHEVCRRFFLDFLLPLKPDVFRSHP